jgi:general secretion pathway protein K
VWRRADTRGIALVSALWGSAIIAVIVLSVLQLVRSDAGTGRGRRDVAALGAIADGAINLTILTMLSPEGAQTPTDGTPLVVAFAGHDVQVSVHDEAGKIDVNLANAPTLGRILVSVGVDGNTAQQLAESSRDGSRRPERRCCSSRPRSCNWSAASRRTCTGGSRRW